MIFLSIPYTHENADVVEYRVSIAQKTVAFYLNKGEVVYCPIAFFHNIGKQNNIPLTWAHWKEQCKNIIAMCNKLVVVMIEGWEASTGVTEEIQLAKDLNIPVEYVRA